MKSVNCQGLGNAIKRRDIFAFLRKKNLNIYFLQDTHFTPTDQKFIKTQSGYKAYFSSYKSNSRSRGVALIFNNNSEFSVEKEIYDESGNYVILHCTIEIHKFILANILTIQILQIFTQIYWPRHRRFTWDNWLLLQVTLI